MTVAPSVSASPIAPTRPSADTSPSQREELTRRLLIQRREEPDPEERRRLRDAVVLMNLPIAESIAAHFRSPNVEWEDLRQVAMVGLVLAVDRFDVDRGCRFGTFAIPTITGEVKRYFRDCCWRIRPPRKVQENVTSVSRCRLRLAQSLGRTPTTAEIADALQLDHAAVSEASSSWKYFLLESLSQPTYADSDLTLGEALGQADLGLEYVDINETLAALLKQLTPDERLLLTLRFEEGLSQSQIALRFGISQMQVSRRLHALLTRLRDKVNAHDEDTGKRPQALPTQRRRSEERAASARTAASGACLTSVRTNAPRADVTRARCRSTRTTASAGGRPALHVVRQGAPAKACQRR